jgi:ribonuclease E
MSKEIYISSTPHETRLAIVEKDELTEIYYERENEYTLAGSIYNGRVTRVLPGMQSSFVDIGLERDAFLYITDFMEEAGDSAEFEGGEANRSEGARQERGGRDRGRGRRDGRSHETAPSTDAGTEDDAVAPGYDQPVEIYEAAPREPSSADTDEASEGEGGRRWRGRRGRRRGRSGGPGDGFERPEGADRPAEARTEPSFAAPSDDTVRDTVEIEAAADRAPREHHDRGRDRGGRNGRRDGRSREPRSERGEETFDQQASAPPVEPFILPGESLSKYRGGDSASHASQPASASYVAPRPSTEVVPLVGWDGGSVLPGETLSRRSGSSDSPASSRSESFSPSRDDGRRGSGDRGRDRRRDRDQQRGRSRDEQTTPDRRPTLDPAQAVQPAVSSAHDTFEAEYEPAFTPMPYEAQTDALPAEHEPLTPVTEALVQQFHDAVSSFEADQPASIEPAESAEGIHENLTEFHETTTEYEPGHDASASYRVDPTGPSEFRQSTPPFEEVEAEAEATVEHAFTNVQPSGEMLSETEEDDEPANPAAPIEHETAVQSVTLHEAETDATPFHPQPEETPQQWSGDAAPRSEQTEFAERNRFADQGFAPGDGQLEEELLDDEETELTTLHASAFDDTEEETLENAADLGSMIRDMSIDEITGAPSAEDEEDDEIDFDDEDDFEEDELASTGELSDEEEADDELSGSDVSEAEEEEFAEAVSYDENGEEIVPAEAGEQAPRSPREGGRRRRRGGRDRDRGAQRTGPAPGREPVAAPRESVPAPRERDRERGGRERGRERFSGNRNGGRPGNRSMQSTNLPAISDLLKPGQEVLVQIAKEPIAKKGARITSHIALPGRFLVFMPTVNHTGVSRKIESDGERRRLKEILLSEKGDAQGGFIVRTAASGASEEELRSDLRFLLNLWADIKSRSESSKSPALIYHDLNLVERVLRDQVTDNFSAIWCDTETEYERVLRFLQRFQPSLIRRVKLYTKDTPLFEQFGITEEINKALRSKVWLKSGGSIVINQTEALVAIDINTGKFVGKTARLEDTIVKTNLDAIPEIVRQIRLRDLGGIIIIDFIDMDERKNRNKVMAALEEELKNDRAPSKVLQFNDFGLVAITRKRVKQSLERTLSTTCNICTGTGMVKSPVTVCNEIYTEMRKMHKVIEKGDIMLRVHPEVVKQLKSNSGRWLQEMEDLSGKTILVKSDPSLHPEQFDIH